MSAVEAVTRSTLDTRVFTGRSIERKAAQKVNILEELSNFIIGSKYARFDENKRRRESWEEAVARVEGMHLDRFAHLSDDVKNRIREAFDFVRAKRVVPSMRSMQFGGKAVEAHNARIYNCAVRHLDSVRAFSELFYLLLCGCGTGIGLSRRYVNRLPKLISPFYGQGEPYIYVVADTIEGWADSLEVLLKSYTKGNELSGKEVQFDYSLIRPKGTKLKTGGGKAPGPFPLRTAHNEIRSLLEEAVINKQEQLRTIDAYDIMMFAADAVLSGGVRRSATCVVFDKDDELMLNAKAGDWYESHRHRERSNNSVLLLRDEITAEDFDKIFQRTKQWGEPGFVFADSPDTLYNPCFEVGFVPVTEDGRTGVQFCNLSSINGSKINTEKEFMECAEAAAIIGTLQATYTDFPYLSETAKELTESESLLGVSIIAMMEKPDILLDPRCQQEAAKVVVDTNKKWSEILGINAASRCTVIKPDGTCALALGTMSSGIHPAHAHKMFRRVQVNRNEPVYQFFQMNNPHLCETSTFKPETDDVVTFPVEVPKNAKVKADLTAIEHLEIIKSTQQNWVLTGSTGNNRKGVHHNVSCTVIVKPEEWADVERYLFENRDYFSAVSFVPATADKQYQQAPMEAVTTLSDESKFAYMLSKFKPVDYTLLREEEDATELQQEIACAGGMCELR